MNKLCRPGQMPPHNIASITKLNVILIKPFHMNQQYYTYVKRMSRIVASYFFIADIFTAEFHKLGHNFIGCQTKTKICSHS